MIVKTELCICTIDKEKPKFLLSFYHKNLDLVQLHGITYIQNKDRPGCDGQWIIKYKK